MAVAAEADMTAAARMSLSLFMMSEIPQMILLRILWHKVNKYLVTNRHGVINYLKNNDSGERRHAVSSGLDLQNIENNAKFANADLLEASSV